MMNLTRVENPVTPEPGIYYNVPFDEYLTWNAMSKSMTDAALRSGRHLKAFVNGFDSTRSMNLGSLVDCKLLEPHLYDSLFAMQPATYESEKLTGRAPSKIRTVETKPWNANSKTCKEIASRLGQSGKTIVSQGVVEHADNITAAVLSNPEAALAVIEGTKQVSIVWKCPHTGILCKGRLDIVHGDYLYDLKTTMDARPSAFSRAIAKFNYHVQGGIYSEAWEILGNKKLNFRFIAAETDKSTEKPEVALYEMLWDDDCMLAGRLKFKRACEAVLGYNDDSLAGYSEFAEPISIPMWALREEFALHPEDEVPI